MYSRPKLYDQLNADWCMFGACAWAVIDNPNEYSVIRIPPLLLMEY